MSSNRMWFLDSRVMLVVIGSEAATMVVFISELKLVSVKTKNYRV